VMSACVAGVKVSAELVLPTGERLALQLVTRMHVASAQNAFECFMGEPLVVVVVSYRRTQQCAYPTVLRNLVLPMTRGISAPIAVLGDIEMLRRGVFTRAVFVSNHDKSQKFDHDV